LIESNYAASKKRTYEEAWGEAIEILRQVGIADPQHVSMNILIKLSGGMRQRVMIAMAYELQSGFIDSDEPTTGS